MDAHKNRLKRKLSEEDAPSGKSHFDRISEEAVENIVRFTSEKPRHPSWMAFIPTEDSLSLLRSVPALARSSRHHFRSLNADRPCDALCREGASVTVGRRGMEKGHFSQLMFHLRKTLVELKIGAIEFSEEEAKPLLSPCPQLKRLSIHVKSTSADCRLDRFSLYLVKIWKYLS